MELLDWSLEVKAKAIGAEYLEVVRTKRMYNFFGDMVVMFIDDSGFAENKPVNLISMVWMNMAALLPGMYFWEWREARIIFR